MKKISIILPIYNVEQYLQECIDSIVNQVGFEQCEMLLIDDGSMDGSSLICDKNAEADSRIVVYHKENGGLSDARNYGMRRATGQYVLFFDSDDLMMPDVLQRILNNLDKKEDILIMDAVCIDEHGHLISNPDFEYKHVGLQPSKKYSGEQAVKEQLNAGVFQTIVVLGVYRRDFLLDNQLWFKKELLHEDELWSPKTFLVAKSVVYEPIVYYAYRIRNNSIMHNKKKDNSKNIASLIYIYSHITKFYDRKITDEELLVALKDDVSRRYLHCITVWRMCDYPKLMKRVDRWEILKNSKTSKNRIRAVVLLINVKLYTAISLRFVN